MSETFGDVIAYSGGNIEFRVRVEGCPLEFCTSHGMAGERVGGGFDGPGAAGVRRVGGLRRDGLSFQESAYLPGADYKASVGSVTIEDTDEVAWNLRAASSVFSKIPRVVSRLTGTVSASDTVWPVASPAAFTAGRVYHIDTEAVRVDTVGGSSITVTRGMWGTSAQAHFVGVSTLIGDRTLYAPIYDAVPTYRRRRVWIYAHGPENLGVEDVGTLLFRGVISGAPQLSEGTTWSFGLAPLTSLLDADIGPREGAAAIRGIYYPGASPLRIVFTRYSTSTILSGFDGSAAVLLSGFFESQSAFCQALNDKINANATIATWNVRLSARPVGERWEIVYEADPADRRYLTMVTRTSVDGFRPWTERMQPSEGGYGVTSVGSGEYILGGWTDGGEGRTGPGTPAAGWRMVPRAQLFAHDDAPDVPAQVAAYPWHRVYLASVAGVSVGDIVRVDDPRSFDGGTPLKWEATITVVNPDEGYIEWDPDTQRDIAVLSEGSYDPRYRLWTAVTPASMPEVTLVRNYGSGVSFAGFLQAVWNDAPGAANAGVIPFVTVSDFDSYDAIALATQEAAMGAPWLLRRSYRFAQPVRFADVVKHECRLLGIYMATTVDGAITFRPLTTRLTADATIESADLINDESLGEIVTEPDGILTGLTIRTGYDAFEDDHKGQTHEVTILSALAIQRQRTALEVAPKSRAAGSEPTVDELMRHVSAPMSLWSRQRMQVSFDVRIGLYDTLIGDCAFVTVPQLPYDGERAIDGGGGGMLAIRGTVVGRSWQLDQPALTLTVLFDSLDVAGYTPTGRVTATSGGGTSWTLTLDADEYGPGGSVADASFFLAGMQIRLVEWDAASPTVRTGEVVSVSGNDVTVLLGSSWTPGAATWNLHYAETTTSNFTTRQREQALIARSDGRVYIDGGTIGAKEMAP